MAVGVLGSGQPLAAPWGAEPFQFATAAAGWPSPPAPAAYRGFAGEVIATVNPYTEADPVGVLVHLLVAFGAAAGSGAHMDVSASRHPARLFVAVVGKSAKARKGTSWQPVRQLFMRALPEFAEKRIWSGLSSGEGLIHAVRDPREEVDQDRRTGASITRVADHGEPDKRLLVVEAELARPLKVMSRQGNTLSAILRDAWDTGDLRVMIKESVRASDAHICVIGHITQEELQRELNDVSYANGFANRFLWIPVTRSKLLPEPPTFEGPEVDALSRSLSAAADFARQPRSLERDAEARAYWNEDLYGRLAAERRQGLAASVVSRAETQVLRLSLCYALLERSTVITLGHLMAAEALWDYSDRGVTYLFGQALGDPMADAILAALRGAPAEGGLSRTHMQRVLFANHKDRDDVARALALLEESELARRDVIATSGRHREVWHAV